MEIDGAEMANPPAVEEPSPNSVNIPPPMRRIHIEDDNESAPLNYYYTNNLPTVPHTLTSQTVLRPPIPSSARPSGQVRVVDLSNTTEEATESRTDRLLRQAQEDVAKTKWADFMIDSYNGYAANFPVKEASEMAVLVAQYLEDEEKMDSFTDVESAVVKNFQCPITHCFFTKPVVVSDGCTYEEDAIHKIVESSTDTYTVPTSPMTKEIIKVGFFPPNRALSETMESFVFARLGLTGASRTCENLKRLIGHTEAIEMLKSLLIE